MNKAWQAAALTAAALLAWLKLPALAATWPWAADIITAWDRISALPQPP
jgi:hypothetical protein